jgi:Carboxypeptidase regulatory-like domain
MPALTSRTANVAAAIALGVSLHIAGAQETVRRGVIDGVVTDSALVPLGDATVSFLGSTVRVVTGPNGRFRVRDMQPGAYILIVRRIGFEAVSFSVRLTPGDTMRPSFALQRAATALDTVRVQGQQLAPAIAEFESRRKLGFGHFVTQADIEKRNVAGLSDLLAAVPSVRMEGAWPTARRMYPLKSCPFVVYIDGVKLPVGDIDNIAMPKELAGIEVYSGAATIPLQYKPTSGSFCGVILLWTRVGS